MQSGCRIPVLTSCLQQREKLVAATSHKDENRTAPTCSCCAADEVKPESIEPGQQSKAGPRQKGIRPVPAAYRLPVVSFVLLLAGLFADHVVHPAFFTGHVRLVWYAAAYLPVGLPVSQKALQATRKGHIFTEFLLMSIAALGAFAIGAYSEGVAVLLFYCVGELVQAAAVKRSRRDIKALLDMRPERVRVLRQSRWVERAPAAIGVGEVIQVRAGERVALDGILRSEQAAFDTAALTGESQPDNKHRGDTVLAGMISLRTVAEIEVTAPFKESQLSRILQLVQEATQHKAPPELFISRFARYYTPAVVLLAAALCFLPYFFVDDFSFREWLYRALVFLVVSCPCALVVSIPLGYFGGIGLASRNGILFKGANFLDRITQVDTVLWDKTGTLTQGVFQVQQLVAKKFDPATILLLAGALERQSGHPIAVAIAAYAGDTVETTTVSAVEEIPGRGIKGMVDGHMVLIGNQKLFQHYAVRDQEDMAVASDAAWIGIAIDGEMAGYLVVADAPKADSERAISGLKALGIKNIMLSGDKTAIVLKMARQLGLHGAYGDLLPEEKVQQLHRYKKNRQVVAFVGDGINDAPVMAHADIGIAMGGLGSDAAIETADVVIQGDLPSGLVTAIRIGKGTRAVVWQNILLALGVKLVVLLLGAEGVATLWEAVFADVGVALLAILNAVRLLRQKNS